MEDHQETAHLPPLILFVGLILVLGCCIWSGVLFFVYKGSIIYGVIASVCVGATYAFLKQIKAQFFAGKPSKE